MVSFGLIPIAIGISVLRYRLFDIDVVINRALLFGAMAIFISGVYVGIVVGVGALVGSQASPVLSAAAAAVVALAFQPARRRAQRFADRLVYGKRATPYEVLSQFSERLGKTYANEDVLPTDGAGARRGDGRGPGRRVGARRRRVLRADAVWPSDAEGARTARRVGEHRTRSLSPRRRCSSPSATRASSSGALSIAKTPGRAGHPTEEKLVSDLAAQAGLVMRNVALTEQLMGKIEELRASRQRLVSAQDEERRSSSATSTTARSSSSSRSR